MKMTSPNIGTTLPPFIRVPELYHILIPIGTEACLAMFRGAMERRSGSEPEPGRANEEANNFEGVGPYGRKIVKLS